MILISRQGETRLVETLSDITDSRDQWQLLVYNLSELLDEYKSDYQLRIAMNLAHDLLHSLDGGIYMCSNGDLAILVSRLNPQLARKLTFQLRYLYMDDPLAYEVGGDENEAFFTHYLLHQHYAECFDRFSKQMVRAERASQPAKRPIDNNKGIFNASRMASVESQLARVDLTDAMRRQAIYVLTHNVQLRRVFEEMYIHIPHLRELLDLQVDFLSNPWLFKYLTQILDERMLRMLQDKKQSLLASPISINVNASTLLSDAFIKFDASLDSSQKVAVVFEVPVVDAFADTHGFIAACKTAQKRGYRVCLDGLNEMSFIQIPPEAFGADLVKLQWSAASDTELNSAEKEKLRHAAKEVGSKRLILCRCDNEDAIEYGKALGISLFQGRWLDQQMHPDSKQAN